jgi:hypothetical protein
MNWLKRRLLRRGAEEFPSVEVPKMPRHLKYAWAAMVSLLAIGSMALDSGSKWLPLVHQMIDLMQQQNLPTENRSDTSRSVDPQPPNAGGN